MNILILSNSNPNKTAGIVAKDILNVLRSRPDNNVKLVVRIYDKYEDRDIVSIQGLMQHYLKWFIWKVLRVLKIEKGNKNMSGTKYSIQDFDQTETYYATDKILNCIDFTPDLIVVLFMQQFLSFKNLYELNNITNAPILLYMMDMAAMTGGCHYAWDCEGYKNKCGHCPAIYSTTEHDQTRINFEYKKLRSDKTNIVPLAGSSWQLEQIKMSDLFKDLEASKLLLLINDTLFQPNNKLLVKQELGLPAGKKIIFFGATALTNMRKGFAELIKVLKILYTIASSPNNIHLAIAGNNIKEFEQLFPFSYTMLGYLDHVELPKAFQAADLFVSPSIEDSGPMMINQALMCGTPVVAFKIGVALDLVINGKTGYVADLQNCKDMANGINDILNMDELKSQEIERNCRELALNLFSTQSFLNNFENIVKGL